MSEALDLLSALVLEDGRRWGDAAVGVQWTDAEAVLDQESSTPYHWLGRSRGYSKTSDLGGMAIAVLLAQAPARARLFGIAADVAQGSLLLDAIGGFASRTPELQGALELQETKVIAVRTGATLTILPADASTVWGLRPFFVVADEVTQWHETPRTLRVWEGVTTGLPKVAGSRLAALCSAGDPAHFSYGIRNHALDDPLWRVHEVPGPPPWLDRERLEGERRRLPESSYRRLFMNEWTSGEDRLADEEDLLACQVLDDWPLEPKPGTRYVIGVDIGVKSDATAAAICHSEPLEGAKHPRVILDRLQTWVPRRGHPVKLGLVEEWLAEFGRRYRAVLRFDPSQGLHMMQRLKRAGLRVEEFTFGATSVGRIATTLLELIRERALALPSEDAELLAELRKLRLVERSPGQYRVDHPRGGHDDRAIAVAIAAATLIERPPVRRGRTDSPFKRGRNPFLGPRLASTRNQAIVPAADGRGSLEAFR